jgi:hypothetical protein
MDTSCKIGVVVIPTTLDDCLICIGEVYMKDIIADIDKLYSLHKDTNCLSQAEAWSDGNKTCIDIGEEISWLRSKYMLTRTVQSSYKVVFDRQRCSFPVLYDVTCGVPLFLPEPVPRNTMAEGKFMFMVWHGMAPNIRRSVIDECVHVAKGTKCPYIVYSNLDKQYLRRLGVEQTLIIQLPWVQFADIMKTCTVTRVFSLPHQMILALPISVMHRAVTFIREGKRSGIRASPLQMVCPFDDEDESW